VIVNAAGAWADEIASLAGTMPVGLEPKRRTAFLVPVPAGVDTTGWPLIDDVGEEFYFKRDAGALFVSPADARPSPPMDAYAEELDVAVGVERLERATTLVIPGVSLLGRPAYLRMGRFARGRPGRSCRGFFLARRAGRLWRENRAGAISSLCGADPAWPVARRRVAVGRNQFRPVPDQVAGQPLPLPSNESLMTIQRFDNGSRFCRVLSYNGTVYLAGMTADDTDGNVVAQTQAVLGKIDHFLAMAGSDKTKLLSAVIWLRDIADFDKMNMVWDRWIDRSALPVRATVEARLAGDAYRVEIMVTAAAGVPHDA